MNDSDPRNQTTASTLGSVVFGPSWEVKTAIGSPLSSLPTLSTPITWGSAICSRCLQGFDYIKQDRMPVPVMCKRCDP